MTLILLSIDKGTTLHEEGGQRHAEDCTVYGIKAITQTKTMQVAKVHCSMDIPKA